MSDVATPAFGAPDFDVIVVGGTYEGSIGVWEGLADPRADDPLGAVRVDGTLRAIPLGDLQRVTA